MKPLRVAVIVVALLGLIVLPALVSVNYSFGNAAPHRADGGPAPLPGPPNGGVLVADGGPAPLPGPPNGGVLVADGGPAPLPGPPNGGVLAVRASA